MLRYHKQMRNNDLTIMTAAHSFRSRIQMNTAAELKINHNSQVEKKNVITIIFVISETYEIHKNSDSK